MKDDSTAFFHIDQKKYMHMAFMQAEMAFVRGEVPVGAILVAPDGSFTSGYNQSIHTHDPSGHAEMIAIRRMAKRLGNYRLSDCTLFVTLMPCLMCAGAIQHARIRSVYYATEETKYQSLLTENLTFKMIGPLARSQGAQVLKDFFRWRRFKAQAAKLSGAKYACPHATHARLPEQAD